MNLLAIDPVILTLAICVIGVSYRILSGMIGKKWSEFSVPLMTTTFMVGLISAIALVAPVIKGMPDDSDSLVVLSVIAGQILAIMGADAATRKGYKVAEKRILEKKEEVKPD